MGIRKYIARDFPDISEIYSHSKLDELINEKSEFSLIPLNKDNKRLQILMASDIYVYTEQNIIGYGGYNNREITALFVHPEHRGRGVGIALLEFLISKIPSHAYLYVAKSNIAAITLYRKHEFEIVDEFQAEYNGIPVLANKMIRSSTG